MNRGAADRTWLLVGAANDEENGGSCGSHGWMERERERRKERERDGERERQSVLCKERWVDALCVCVFSTYLLAPSCAH